MKRMFLAFAVGAIAFLSGLAGFAAVSVAGGGHGGGGGGGGRIGGGSMPHFSGGMSRMPMRPGGFYAHGMRDIHGPKFYSMSHGHTFYGTNRQNFYSLNKYNQFKSYKQFHSYKANNGNRNLQNFKEVSKQGNLGKPLGLAGINKQGNGKQQLQKLTSKNFNQVKYAKNNAFFDKKKFSDKDHDKDHKDHKKDHKDHDKDWKDHDHDHDRWRDHFGHWYGYRWYGPVFWPYAFGDYFSYAFWPYDYYDTFWGYGPNVIIWDAFWPYGEFDDAVYDDEPVYDGDIYRPYRRRRAAAPSQPTGGSLKDAAGTCSSFAPGVSELPIAQLDKIVDATEEQRAALNDLKAASAKAADVLKQSCSSETPLTPMSRLDSIEKRLQTMEDANAIVREPLVRLYALLTPAQKQKLESATHKPGQRRKTETASVNLEELCTGQAEFTKVPADQIAASIKLNDDQQQQLDKLRQASESASGILKNSCPATVPQDIEGRLDSAQKRVDSLIQAVETVKPAVSDFYASLTDEQKAALSIKAKKGTQTANNRG